MNAADEIGRLDHVFLNAAEAVRGAQRRLEDLVPVPSESEPPVFPARLYAIPRASVSLSFGFRIVSRGRIFLVPRSKASKLLVHRLHFDLVATPQPPAAPPATYRRELLQPSFLLTAEEEKRRRAELAADLEGGGWRFPPNPAKENEENFPEFHEKVRKEGEEVRESKAMIFFRLPQRRLLAVRLGRGPKKDGLYLHEPEEAVPWAVYNFRGDREKGIHYRPLSFLVQGLRRWQATGEALRSPDSATFRGGFENLRAVQSKLESGLKDALEGLSRPGGATARRTAVSTLEPTFYDFAGIEALVSFSMGEADVDFIRMSSEVDPERDDVPASVVRIRVEPSIEAPSVTTELLELEYLLVGEDRRSAIELIVEKKPEPSRPLQPYRELIEDPDRQRDALLLRSFHKKKERLLVIWPAGDDEDLVFGCRRNWRPQAEIYEIGKIKVAKKPDEPAHGVTLLADEDEDDEEVRFKPFHRFFRTVLAWNRRGEADA